MTVLLGLVGKSKKMADQYKNITKNFLKSFKKKKLKFMDPEELIKMFTPLEQSAHCRH